MYFGEVARAQALTGDPNMLAAILSISIIFISNKILQYKYNQMLLIALFCCCLGLIFTMSKSFLLTLGIVLILINYTHVSTAFFLRRKKYLLNIISITLISLFLLITHFYITPIHTNPLLVNKGGSFINEKPLLSNDKWAIYETSYSINKKVSYHLFQTHFFWGVGAGKQVTFCDELKEKSLYPKSFGCLDPHCSYTGAFAEAGIFGGLSYLFFIFSLLYSINIMLNNKNLKNNFVYYGLFAAILFATVEALTLENNTFRHHWLCFGILSGLFSYYKNKLCLNTTKSVS